MSDSAPTSQLGTLASSSDPATSPRGYIEWIFWILAGVILLLGLGAVAEAFADKTIEPQIVIGLIWAFTLLAFLPRVADVQKLQVGKSLVTLEMAVKEAKEAADEAREKLDRFIFLAMPKPTYANLVKLADPPFGRYDVTEGFKAQLRFLRDAGYITLDCYVGELRDGEDLSLHAQVTDLGREFIKNRRRLIPNEQL